MLKYSIMYQTPQDGFYRAQSISRTSDLDYMKYLQGWDIDAGRVDPELDRAISDVEIYRGFMDSVAGLPPEQQELMAKNLYTYGRFRDFIPALKELNTQLDTTERHEVLPLLSSLLELSPQIGGLYPGDLSKAVTEAFGESITSTIFTLAELKRGEDLPKKLPLKGDREVVIGSYTFEDCVDTLRSLDSSLRVIIDAKNAINDGPVTRVNNTGAYGMYRFGQGLEVLATIRLVGGTSYDPNIEYGNKMGTQASIGYTVEEGLGIVSAYRGEQSSPFCIRIDNEGDQLALDIGSIFGLIGSLGKRVADIIALGDNIRSGSIRKNPSLNHNSRGFNPNLSEKEVFARMAAEIAAELETRANQTTVKQQLRALVLSGAIAL